MDTNKLVDNGFKILSEIHQKITFADGKANFLVVIDLALFGVTVTLLKDLEIVFKSMTEKGVIGGIIIAMACMLAIVSLVLISSGIYHAINAINPRLSSQGKKRSLIYFGAIANMNQEDFRKYFKAGTESELSEDIMNQIHENSVIANAKFARVGASAKVLVYSLISVAFLSLVYFILSTFQ